jgi:hypothetical protein
MKYFSRTIRQAVPAVLPLVLAAALVSPGRAQEPDSTNAPRFFGGHLFLPSMLVPDPFISTTFTSSTGFGKAINIKVPIENLQGAQVGELSGDVGFMLLEFDYQYAFNNRWALRVGASGGARSGTSVPALLAEGASAIYGYEFGGSVKLLRKRNWMVTGTADLRGNTLYGIAPLDFAKAVKNSVASGDTVGAISGAEDVLLSSTDNARLLAGLRGAYTPSAWIGFMAFVEAGTGDRFDQSSNSIGVANFGGAASIDLRNLKGHVPFGLQGAYRSETLSERSNDTSGGTSTAGLGILYTGRRFFSIGLENAWQQIHQPINGKEFSTIATRILMRYDFK